MITISVPTSDDLEHLGEAPDGVEVLVWNGHGERPDGADRIALFVGQYNAAPPDRAVLEALPQLRIVQLTSAGVEPWLPVVPQGVALCNGRGIHGGSTAELGFAGLLAVLRDLPAYRENQSAHVWERWQTGSLDGRRVLVIGAGDIGDRLAAASRVFGAETTTVARRARDGVRTMDELPALLPEHDVVALALPLTDDTRGLVDARFLAAMPDGAVLVNVARGAVVDTDALLAELDSGRLCAFLDVTDPEPLPADHPLWDAPNLVLTPHVGGGTQGWERRAYRLVREQAERLRDGREPLNPVTDGY
ncbi:2-hydroxyacid dehydrogenase [Jatrophihabitans endophyticus]|uniref:2-hydroxyacid dehydrogenase n=1 Tax=Jatrophihabitans endophyticus TaxID=1206085 RepID=UPI0026F37A76|nr:2-hydroxyacid dehydrogenase [Jatrophihabitans endophyticus]